MQVLGILPQKITHPVAHIITDMEENKSPKGDLSSKRKLLCQRRSRRKLNLMKKACDYSKMFDADVCVGIRLRETGEVMFLSADPLGFWDSFRSRLVHNTTNTQREAWHADNPRNPIIQPRILLQRKTLQRMERLLGENWRRVQSFADNHPHEAMNKCDQV